MMRAKKPATIAERLRVQAPRFTVAEKKLAQALQSDYPVCGLASMPEFARRASVSTPSVLRFAKKLGFAGFPAFQKALRAELSARLQNPIIRQEKWAAEAPKSHVLNRFAQAALENLKTVLQLIDHREFDAVASLIANPRVNVHVLGGRITGALAHYLATHLQMARASVFEVPLAQSLWPQHLLEISATSVLLVFDVRRYDVSMREFAASAKRRGAKVVLITDTWMSPIARFAVHSLPLRIEVPTSWDSHVVSLFVAETLVAAVVEKTWPRTQTRIAELETLRTAASRDKP